MTWSAKWVRTVAILASILILFFCGFLLGEKHCEKCRILDDVEKVDTLTIYDTIPYYSPIPSNTRKLGENIPVLPGFLILPGSRDTVEVKDTIYLPREEKTYQDSTYKAVVSGYEPSLDYIEVYPKREIITRDRTVTVKKNPHFGIGIQAGYGMTMADGRVIGRPYVGAGITWMLYSW